MSQQSSPQISILFVCLGNICRSPMAEGVFRSLTKSNPRIGTIDSAGTGAYHTHEPPDYRTMQTLHKHGIRDYEHGARRVVDEDFAKFDYIFAMDAHNLRDLQRMQRRLQTGTAEKTRAQVMLFGMYRGKSKAGKGEEVVDPYYGADDGFGEVFEQVSRFSRNFLSEVVEKKS